jgi:capsid protein
MRLIDVQGDLLTPTVPKLTDTTSVPTCPSPVGTGYEGADSSGLRANFLTFPINVRREMSSYTRKELVRKQRALDANLGIFSRIHRKIGQHSVGMGIFPRPITKDPDWNAANRKRFEARASNALLYSAEETYDFWEDQRFVAEKLPGDGESFTGLVEVDGRRCTQRFDVFEIESPRAFGPSVRLPDGTFWADGVRVTAYDAPRAYGVRELPRVGVGGFASLMPYVVREIAAASILHVFQHRRAHQGRGVPWCHNGMNDGIDALDLKALEKGSAKLHSMLGISVKKKSGDAGANGIGSVIQKALGSDGQVTRVDENFWRGAAIQYLATDEGIELHTSERPSPNLLAFLEFLYREIANGYDLPLDVVYKMDRLGGAAARAVLEDAQWLFDSVQDKVVMRHSRRFYIWDTAQAMVRGELPVCKDPEWWACAWRGPAKLTVDLGRTADAAVKLMKNAALSHVRYYEERAQDAYSEMEEEIQFRSWLRDRCKQAGVEYAELIEPTPGAVTNVHVQPQDNAA